MLQDQSPTSLVWLVGPLMTEQDCRLLERLYQKSSKSLPFLAAVDGGLKFLKKLRILPDLAIGDWDSLARTPKHQEAKLVHTLDIHKNESDLVATFKYLIRKKTVCLTSTVTLFGMQGQRIDHEIAILQDLKSLSKRVRKLQWLGERASVYFAKRGHKLKFNSDQARTFSVLPYQCDKARVSLQGVRYYPKGGWIMRGSQGLSNVARNNRFSIEIISNQVMIVFDRVEGSGLEHVLPQRWETI